MRKIILVVAVISATVTLVNCKVGKKASEASTTAEFKPSSAQMAEVTKRWPGTTELEVKEGQTIYSTKCIRCHKPVEITSLTEKKWLHEIDEMSPKANLSEAEKLALTKHILSYREVNTVN